MAIGAYPSSSTRHLWMVLLLGVCWLPATVVAGEVDVLNAETVVENNVYLLNASISYQLDDELIEALHNGVALPLRLNVEIYKPRDYLPDQEVASLKQRYELSYHVLSEQYILVNLNSGASESFAYLGRALAKLGAIEKLPLIDGSLLEPDEKYMVRIQVGIATSALAIPLRLLSFIYSEWRLESDWYSWPL
jgi:hypothetical protein